MLKWMVSFIGCLVVLHSPALPAQAPSMDAKAEGIAKECIAAMGGAEHFASTNYIGWTFFGNRKLIWDKLNDRVRVDYVKKQLTIITSLHSDETLLFMNGVQITQPDSLKKYSVKGKRKIGRAHV